MIPSATLARPATAFQLWETSWLSGAPLLYRGRQWSLGWWQTSLHRR